MQPEIGGLVQLRPAFTGAVNTPRDHTHGIVVSSEIFYGDRIQVLVGDCLWLLTQGDFEVPYA